MLAEEWPHALQAAASRRLGQQPDEPAAHAGKHNEETQREAEGHRETQREPLQPAPPSVPPPAATVRARARPASAPAVAHSGGEPGPGPEEDTEQHQPQLPMHPAHPAPPAGSRPPGSVPLARIHRGSKSKIDDVLRRYASPSLPPLLSGVRSCGAAPLQVLTAPPPRPRGFGPSEHQRRRQHSSSGTVCARPALARGGDGRSRSPPELGDHSASWHRRCRCERSGEGE